VLGERLRRVEVERVSSVALEEGIEDGQVVGERLSARRAGDDEDVATFEPEANRTLLMRPELLDALFREPVSQPRMELLGKGARPGGSRRELVDPRDLLERIARSHHLALERGTPRGLGSHDPGLVLPDAFAVAFQLSHGLLLLTIPRAPFPEHHRGGS